MKNQVLRYGAIGLLSFGSLVARWVLGVLVGMKRMNAVQLGIHCSPLVLPFIFLFSASVTAQTNYQGVWWNPNKSGMGINVGQQMDVIVVGWYLYDIDGSDGFLTMAGNLEGETVTGELVRSEGPAPGFGYDPALVEAEIVGTATIDFLSPHTARLTYNYDVSSGVMRLERFTFNRIVAGGTFSGGGYKQLSGCNDPSNDGLRAISSVLTIEFDGKDFVMEELTGPECIFVGSAKQRGNRVSGSGTYTCPSGDHGEWSFLDMEITPRSAVFDLRGYSHAAGCNSFTDFAAIEYPSFESEMAFTQSRGEARFNDQGGAGLGPGM